MIKLLTKDRYYRLLGEVEGNYKSYHVLKNVQMRDNTWKKFISTYDYFLNVYYYLEDENICFVYIYNLKLLFIPKKYNRDPENILKLIISSDTTLNNWEINLLSEINSPSERKYLLNTFKFGTFSNYLVRANSTNNTSEEYYVSGNYLITNLDYPEDNIEFSLISIVSYGSWVNIYVSFPEKSRLMLSNFKKIDYKENLIAIILNEYGRDYKRVDIKSK